MSISIEQEILNNLPTHSQYSWQSEYGYILYTISIEQTTHFIIVDEDYDVFTNSDFLSKIATDLGFNVGPSFWHADFNIFVSQVS